MKDMSFYFKDGLIGQHYTNDSWDFGDCAQRVGTYYYGLQFRYFDGRDNYGWPNSLEIHFLEAIAKLEVSPGIWVRHPIQYKEPSDFSRDQQLPIQFALASYGQIDVLKRMIYPQWKHFGKYQNKDVRIWEWAIDFRCLNMWWTYPLLLFLDLGIFINVLVRIFVGAYDQDNVGDDLNVYMSSVFCDSKYPTPLSKIAHFLYKIRNLKRAWAWYFRAPESPPLDELWFT